MKMKHKKESSLIGKTTKKIKDDVSNEIMNKPKKSKTKNSNDISKISKSNKKNINKQPNHEEIVIKKDIKAIDINSVEIPTDLNKKKKIVFNEEGEPEGDNLSLRNSKKLTLKNSNDNDLTKKSSSNVKEKDFEESYNSDVKWFNMYNKYSLSEEVVDIKDKEQLELHNLCKTSFESKKTLFHKRDSSDARWLNTALQKGTAKDRANAGAMLVISNPLGNLEALTTLIGFTKHTNKSSTDVINIITDLWKDVLLPPQRKLLSLEMQGGHWKQLQKNTTVNKELQTSIYAYWYFENELKDYYFEYLKNLQSGLQIGQDNYKNAAINSATQLLIYAPEKELMLLNMLINKLGDPNSKIASKAMYHLTDVGQKHPNMCSVIVAETEKLLFRNNVSDRAQHFALCFLANIVPYGHSEVSTKLVQICFSLFKVLVQKGAINNRIMQAILRCLQKSIVDAKPTNENNEILSKDMQDTIYRLVHLADPKISIQTLGLLMQLLTVKTEKSDRFYNALYKKMLDIDFTNIGTKCSAQFLHILHRAIHMDENVKRGMAFIKRLLQISLCAPSQVTAGCLIILYKLLRFRKDLKEVYIKPIFCAEDEELAKFDGGEEEKYEDVPLDNSINNGISTPKLVMMDHQILNENSAANKIDLNDIKHSSSNEMELEVIKTIVSENGLSTVSLDQTEEFNSHKVREMNPTKYNPYERIPSFSGAEKSLRNELSMLRNHYHPTVQVFAECIINHKPINYYGDPLKDFGLAHFLERFAFKNPKKFDKEKSQVSIPAHKQYVSHGSRAKPVNLLSKTNCTEEEMFIFTYLEQKRKQSAINKSNEKGKTTKGSDDENEDEEITANEVNDDEFEDYLNNYFTKNAQGSDSNLDAGSDIDDIDYLTELGGDLSKKSKTKQKKKKVGEDVEDDDMDDIDVDWGDENEASETGSNVSDDDENSITSNEDDADFDVSDEDMDLSNEKDLEDSNEENDLNFDDDEDTDSAEDEDPEIDSNESDEEIEAPKKSNKSKRPAGMLNDKSFTKKLKHSNDMSSLFAAADDFADILEETGKTKGHGTTNALFNTDKSSDKQLKWEEKRHSNAKFNKRKSNKVGKVKKSLRGKR